MSKLKIKEEKLTISHYPKRINDKGEHMMVVCFHVSLIVGKEPYDHAVLFKPDDLLGETIDKWNSMYAGAKKRLLERLNV